MEPTPMLMMVKGEEGFVNGVQSVDQLVLVKEPHQIVLELTARVPSTALKAIIIYTLTSSSPQLL